MPNREHYIRTITEMLDVLTDLGELKAASLVLETHDSVLAASIHGNPSARLEECLKGLDNYYRKD